MSFGRKGAVPGSVPGTADALAARRAAFIAEERARAANAAAQPAPSRSDPDFALRTPPAYVRQKTNGTAYLLWFFLCGVSAHRFYLGYTASAAVQLSLTPIAYAMILSKQPAGMFVLAAAWLWMLADGFLIPGMRRKANEKARGGALGTVFA